MTPAISRQFQALRDVCDAEELRALRERNEQRAREARERLGTTYACHPDNYVRPKPQQPRGVLQLGR